MTVYDGRTGLVVWDGRLEDPARSAGTDGQVWELTGMGGQAHTRDRIVPLIYVDRPNPGGFDRVLNVTPGGTNSTGDDPGNSGKDALILQFPQGLSINTGSKVQVRYGDVARAGQKLALIGYAWDGGSGDVNMLVESIASTNGGAGEIPRTAAISTAGGAYATRVVGTHWANGRNMLDFRYIRNAGGAYTVPSDLAWASFTDIVVVAMRHNADGTERTTGYSTATVLASDVVADLLGRLLTQYDGVGATIATTTHPIDQLAYPDGVSPDRVLDDLLALESGHTWRVWERNSVGKYRFEFVPVPATVRYEADVLDGYDSQGSADGLYNQVTVRWRDAVGRIQTTTRTATAPALDAAGLTRTGSIDLGTDVGSLAAAQRAGDRWLAERQYPPNAGRLRIARPILDLQAGRMVMPWEIRPGLVRVRGVLPRPDALNNSTRDGVTIFRIVSSEYRASDAAATLELDSYARTMPRMLAELRRRALPVRRR
ncbi:hypothetical protein [Micromonospora sp. NPDC023814]|uniref:hypothetical protein n=1 Tax=Micromonospora sp. NPDC023814 TaxID=3154596 RepID=UPI0033DAEA88